MEKGTPKALLIFAWAFLWCFYTLVQLLSAMVATLIVAGIYSWAFAGKASAYTGTKSILHPLKDLGYEWSAIFFTVFFVVLKTVQWINGRTESDRRALLEAENTHALKSTYGDSAISEPEGTGYVTKVVINGKEFEGGHRMLAMASRHHKINTASAFVRFKIADTKLEMRIAQKAFWISPKKEPLSLGLTRESEPLEVLSHRYDCTFSDRKAIAAFIADDEVQRLLLPKHPNSYERSSLTVKNGEVRIECSADTKSDRHVAEVATFELMKKLFDRAEIFDRRLTEIGNF